jgi:hypothetical protein
VARTGGGGGSGDGGRAGAGGGPSSPPISDTGAEALAATLCRMRDAVLKLGQMLSIAGAAATAPRWGGWR